MATVVRKQCDVFGTFNDVIETKIVYSEQMDGGAWVDVRTVEKQMCPRAIARSLKFIERGTTPPSKKKGK